MVSDESNESYFTDDEATMNMSFQTAMKEADRAEGMTRFKDMPEHLIERTQTGKVINVRPPSPNSRTSTLRRSVSELENELEVNERQADKRKQEYRERLTTLENRLFDLEQQQDDLQSAADGWKVKYERQKELAEEYLKMVDDREMEGHLAVSDLNESLSEESAERSRHLAELKDECGSLKLKVTEAEAKRDEYAAKLVDATQRLLTNTNEVFKLRNELKLRDESIGTLQKESQDHQRRADDAVKVAKDLRDLTATERARLSNEIRQVMEENKVLKENIGKVTEENTELKEAAKTSAEQGMRWEHEAHLLDVKVTALELKDKEWQQSVHQKTQEIIRLNTELIDMTQTVMTREDEVTQTKDQLKAAADEYSKLERDVTQLAEHIAKVEKDTEKVIQDKTLQLHQHMSKVNQENQNLKNEKEQSDLRIKRLEDENKALQMSNKHKDEQLLQHGVRAATVESPPPSYSKAHETGTGKSFHFDMPLRTGTGKGSVKAERDGEKGKDDKEPPSGGYPHSSNADPSQFPPHMETNIFIDERQRDRPSSRQERPRKSRYGKARRNQNDDENSEEDDDQRAENTAVQLTKALNSMARKTPLMTLDGSRDTVSGWTGLVKETQRTYQLTDDQIMIEIAIAVKGPAKTWFEGEKDIAAEDGIEHSITEWMDKFKDEYGDRDEEVLGLREAYARKFELGKESLDQYYQAMMRFKAKKIITEKQAVGFLIEGCRVDNELYKALRIQKCKTPTDVKDFFRHWATGEEKYKAPKGQRNQEYVTIRQGQVENVPQQRMAAAPVQQPVECRVETPVREVTEKVTFIDSQTGQPITYSMVAAIQAAAQSRDLSQALQKYSTAEALEIKTKVRRLKVEKARMSKDVIKNSNDLKQKGS
ncbi:protein bicaudal D homolog 1-like [Paramacrobiotus metropolitanus]|uniref:protein bicaudal D homolog 1-like n=1 Tax=Paramacrobiotus metropolitanus TaxID=2943436 RepID=UPI00244638B8|nr:protein bicaudal D homolog 1-like [Paramacrobiotus metropolitanus]